MRNSRKETAISNGKKFFENLKCKRIFAPEESEEFIHLSCESAEIINAKNNRYYNIPASFDIETSSFISAAGEKTAIMYEWTFGINGFVMIGRTWDQFNDVYNAIVRLLGLSEELYLIVYVHNLSYEFQFIRKRLKWSKVFAVKSRTPLYAITSDGIEFRCSYLQSGYNLENLGKNLHKYHCNKKVGDLDYKKLRTYKTPLTSEEIEYCANDVKVVMCYIQECIENEGNITHIPLTKTGYVRRYVRGECFGKSCKDKKKKKYKRYNYVKFMKQLTIEPEEYLMLKQAFQGGYTHASPFYSGQKITDVTSMDFTSSYPAQMVKQKYPMSKGERYEIKDKDDFIHCLNCYCCIFDIELTHVQSKFFYEDYISSSRCRELQKPVIDNGRLVSADHLITTITEQDFYIICQCYTWDEIKVGTMYRYKKAYMPTDFVRAILNLYKQKTTLKGVKGEEVNYMLYKSMLNSCYGMAVTDIVRPEIEYSNDWEESPADIKKNLDHYNESNNRFLFYPWGVYVTAYSRVALWSAILELKSDYLYSDTDSVKYIHPEKHERYFTDFNKKNVQALKKAMHYHHISESEIAPKTIKGIKKPLGSWDFDGHYKAFKALRAKCYMVQYDNNEINITVSGLNKKITVPYMRSKYKDLFRAFTNKLYVPPEYTGKNTHTYIDDERQGLIADYRGVIADYDEKSSVHLEETDYSLSLADTYVQYLLRIQVVNT